MKLLHILSAGAFLAPVVVSAQRTWVAGWDFSQYASLEANFVDLAFSAPVDSLAANYSDFNAPFGDPNPNSAAFGTFFYDGTHGSSAVASGTLGTGTETARPAAPFDGNATNQPGAQQSAIQPDSVLGSSGSLLTLETLGQEWAQNLAFSVDGDFDLVFSADLSSKGETGSAWSLTFGAAEEKDGDSADITAEIAVDPAGSWTVLGSDTTTPTPTEYTFTDSTGVANGADVVYFRLKLTGVDTRTVLDNVGISATLGAVAPTSWWNASPADANGWRFSGQAYNGENGIGWIWDNYWPWVYASGLDSSSTGDWLYVWTDGGSRSGFYAYVDDGDYWIWASGVWGWYYSFESGNEGWAQFVW